MSDQLNLGAINGHIVGRVLKETVRRAMVIIRNERMIFEATVKEDYDGGMDDVFTSADTKAQAIYVRMFQECFPGCGVIGEEDNLRIESVSPCSAYFTVDPLDGTKAFVREQSHGIGSMVALVDNGVVIAAYVGDVNSDEVFGYRPGTDRVWRITRLDSFKELVFKAPLVKNESYVLLREPPEKYSASSLGLIKSSFGSHLIDGSSIGTWMARLWKREVSAVILPPGWETPWDSTPVMGITQKLGYSLYTPDKSGIGWVPAPFVPSRTPQSRKTDLLIVHRDDVGSILH